MREALRQLASRAVRKGQHENRGRVDPFVEKRDDPLDQSARLTGARPGLELERRSTVGGRAIL